MHIHIKINSLFCSIILLIKFIIPISYANFSSLQFEVFNKKNSNLPINSINIVTEDNDGFIWVGTDYGLRRFNGLEFETLFDITGVNYGPSLDSEIKQLFFDSYNNLWILTIRQGVHRLDLNTYKIFSYNSTSNNNKITPGVSRWIIEDQYSNIWFATHNGLNKFKQKSGKVTAYSTKHLNIGDKSIFSLEYSPIDKSIWIGTDKGIYLFNIKNENTKKITKTIYTPLREHRISFIHYDHNGFLWISTTNNLYFYNYKENEFKESSLKNITSTEFIYTITSKPNGNIFIGTNKDLLVFDSKYNNLKWLHPLSDLSISDNAIYNIFISSNNQLWVSTKFSGLWKANLNNISFSIFSEKSNSKNHISFNKIHSIIEDHNHNPWIITRNKGIDHYNYKTKKWNHYDSHYFLNSNKKTIFKDMTKNHMNSIFFVTTDRIIIEHDTFKKKSKIIKYDNPEYDKYYNNMDRIYFDSKSRLWTLSSPNWLSFKHMNTGKTIFLNDKSGISKSWIFEIFESHNNNIYIITANGLKRYNEITRIFEAIPLIIENITNPPIYSINETPPGILWLGGDYGMLKYHISNNEIQLFNVNNGLSNNIVVDILVDNEQKLWLATFNGLNRFNYQSNKFDIFYREDGLPDNEFDGSVAYKSKNERLYFGTPQGIVYFNPTNIKKNEIPPKISFTTFKISGKKIYLGNKQNPLPTAKTITHTNALTLNHKQNDFTIEFAALDYHNPKRNQYKYKLIGYNENWINTDYKNRTAHYTNLNADTYTLHIKASNHHGVWNEAGIKLQITILPPPWKTWWAYTLYIITTLILIYLFFQYRTKKLRQQAIDLQQAVDNQTIELKEKNQQIEELLERKDQIFANISHELRTPLTLILSPLRSILKKSRESAEHTELNIIQRNAYRLLRMVDQLLELSKLQQANEDKTNTQKDPNIYTALHEIIDSHTHSFQQIAKDKNITLTLQENTQAFIQSRQDPVEKIVLNIISNAIKYTLEEGNIEVSCYWHNHTSIAIKVKDNGIGIPEDKLNSIFERFTRIHDVENQQTAVPGAGIGLALVKELIDSLQGSIAVESILGQGSTFTIHLPAISAEAAKELPETVHLDSMENISIEIASISQSTIATPSTEQTQQTNTEGDKEHTILITEDNADMRQHLAESFSPYYNILTASNGQMGIDMAMENIPDLIISDVMMPEKDGFEVCEFLKEQELSCHIPIILLTALHDRDSRLKGLKHHADDYLGKPFDFEELKIRSENLLTIRNILKQRYTAQLQIPDQNNDNTATTPIENPRDVKFLDKFNHVLEIDYPNVELNMQSIAKKMAISDRQLQRKIKALTGQKPVEYLRYYRIKKSLNLLQEGKDMENVSYLTGFSTRNYFTNCFKAQMGISPSQYQKKYVIHKNLSE